MKKIGTSSRLAEDEHHGEALEAAEISGAHRRHDEERPKARRPTVLGTPR